MGSSILPAAAEFLRSILIALISEPPTRPGERGLLNPVLDLSSIQVDPEWEKSGFKQKSVLLLKNQKGQQYLGSAHIETLRYGLNFKIHMLKP